MDPATLIGLGLAFGGVFSMMVIEGASPMSVVLPGPLVLVIFWLIRGGVIG